MALVGALEVLLLLLLLPCVLVLLLLFHLLLQVCELHRELCSQHTPAG
jgi:hypothetical protein